uniref:Uncharacterized protein n=1 Tax=Rhizophora mucronata TaxID=61149 RepID=A0A2P2N9K3_RHIMU
MLHAMLATLCCFSVVSVMLVQCSFRKAELSYWIFFVLEM